MTREELQHDFHNEHGICWYNSQGEPDIDYVMWLEDKIIAIKNNTSLPPAEGAEEILEKHLGSLMPLKYGVKYNKTIDAMHEFATLHAQKIADKMVSESKELIIGDYLEWFYTQTEPINHSINTIKMFLKSRER